MTENLKLQKSIHKLQDTAKKLIILVFFMRRSARTQKRTLNCYIFRSNDTLPIRSRFEVFKNLETRFKVFKNVAKIIYVFLMPAI